MDTPFEEVLEKAKAGDPKAQTEVRTSVHGEARAALPSAWGARDKLVLSVLVGVGAACLHLPRAGPCLWCFHVCDVLLFFLPPSREHVCVHLCPTHS